MRRNCMYTYFSQKCILSGYYAIKYTDYQDIKYVFKYIQNRFLLRKVIE